MSLTLIFQILWFHGEEETWASVNMPSQGLELAPGGVIRDQDNGFPA